MIRNSIIGKLWISIVALIVIVLLLLSLGLSGLLEDFYYSRISEELVAQGQQVVQVISSETDYTQLTEQLDLLSNFTNAHIMIVDKKGLVEACNTMMGVNSGSFFGTEDFERVFQGEIVTKRGYHHHFDAPMLSAAIPVYEGQEIDYALTLYRPVAPISKTINSMRWLIVYAAIGAILLASIVSFFLSRTLSRPLVQMNKVAAEIAKGNFDHKVQVNSEDEVGLLGATLNHMSNQLREQEQMRRDFIANVSHELRTPLSLMQGYSEAILDGMDEDIKQRNKMISIIHKETIRLKRMVNELLDLSRLQTGHFNLNIQELSISDMFFAIEEKYKPAVENTGIDFKMGIEPDLPRVYADHDRMQQVLINLVENALKHTEEGYISISAFKENEQICIEVTDTGAGIAPEDLGFIWERFYKADKSRSRAKGGTGLGLAIVQNIIKAHNGKVWVKSEIGKGSTFGFCIPVNLKK